MTRRLGRREGDAFAPCAQCSDTQAHFVSMPDERSNTWGRNHGLRFASIDQALEMRHSHSTGVCRAFNVQNATTPLHLRIGLSVGRTCRGR